jgi:hypothetical protein
LQSFLRPSQNVKMCHLHIIASLSDVSRTAATSNLLNTDVYMQFIILAVELLGFFAIECALRSV